MDAQASRQMYKLLDHMGKQTSKSKRSFSQHAAFKNTTSSSQLWLRLQLWHISFTVWLLRLRWHALGDCCQHTERL